MTKVKLISVKSSLRDAFLQLWLNFPDQVKEDCLLELGKSEELAGVTAVPDYEMARYYEREPADKVWLDDWLVLPFKLLDGEGKEIDLFFARFSERNFFFPTGELATQRFPYYHYLVMFVDGYYRVVKVLITEEMVRKAMAVALNDNDYEGNVE